MFQVGEKVVYPQYGLGIITEVTEKKVSDTILNFYRLEFHVKQMEILVPVQRAVDNGLRRVMGFDEVSELITFIQFNGASVQSQQWHRWRKRTMEQLKGGNPMEIAGIYCYLCHLEKKKGLSFTERKILMQVEKMLITEISAAREISETEAEKIVRVNKKEPLVSHLAS
ncbi:MAG: hypothetical protein OEW12_06585 [Deltaproteobacteria bacterium]|nr:hypothetical protein [Deltaproteobacteria bacterium]